MSRVFVIVLDSVGIGAAPDAADYGDEGANTLAHAAASVDGISVPVMQSLGLGSIPGLLPGGKLIPGVAPIDAPRGAYGAMQERSQGKDTTTGHWEMAGLLLEEGFAVFPPQYPSFPSELVETFVARTGRPIIGNKAASGTAIIDELGPEQMMHGQWIAYTSADSVMQLAAHEAVIPLDELYAACEIARELCDPYRVGRVIARPYVGEPGAFTRTQNRRDYSIGLPGPCIIDHAAAHGVKTLTVGKLDDIFPGTPISEAIHHENNADAEAATLRLMRELEGPAFIFVNLIDFDMLYGHRRNPIGYARALEQTDRVLGECIAAMRPDDLLLITADHGNDPTFSGTDHTREFVPLLAYGQGVIPGSIGIRDGFYDLAQTVATALSLPPIPRGISIL